MIKNLKNKIAPSLMCCDFLNMRSQLDVFKANGIEYLHIDVMDGVFVPNYTLGVDFVKQMHRASDIPLDIHLMIEVPENKIEWFEIQKGDIVSVHVEATRHLQRTLQRIKDRGGKPYVAINPATPISMIEDVLDDIDGVLIMSVNPGYAGQKLIPHALEKIRAMREFLDRQGKKDIEIEVDGNVSFENAKLISEAGANIFVAGSSSVFYGEINDSIKRLRRIIDED